MSCPGFSANFTNVSLVPHASQLVAVYRDSNWTELNEACNCTTFKSQTEDANAISIIRIITSLFSIVGSASIILLVLLTGKLNTAEVHPLFILSVADFILAILWLIGGIVWLSPDANGWATEKSSTHTGMCYVLAVATTMAGIITFLLTAVYAQSALLRLREYYNNKGKLLPEQDKKKRLRYIVTGVSYILSWLVPPIVVIPVMEAVVGLEKTDTGCWCIVDFFNLRPDNGDLNRYSPFNEFAIVQATMIGSFFLATALLIIVYYGITLWYIRKVYAFQANQQNNQQRSAKLRKIVRTVMIRLSLFVLIFIVCGAPSFAGSIDVWSERNRLHLSETPDKIILYIHAVLAPMQGFWNAIVYGWSRKEFRKAVRLHGNSRERSDSNYQSLNNPRVDPGNTGSPTH